MDGAAYGGPVGSVRDAARFMSAHVKDGRAHGIQLLSSESASEMKTITATGRMLDVGLGWFRRHSDRKSDERCREHIGGGGGFFNTMRIYLDRGLGVTVMGNARGYDHQQVAAAAHRWSPSDAVAGKRTQHEPLSRVQSAS